VGRIFINHPLFHLIYVAPKNGFAASPIVSSARQRRNNRGRSAPKKQNDALQPG
jgi:hypothetical protein